MKKYLFMTVIILLFNHLYAQKFELSVQAYSGLFHYSGNGAVSTSFFIQSSSPGHDYTNNPYGNKNAFSYGAGLQVQHISKSGLIIGLGAGYEILRSSVVINGYNHYYDPTFYAIATVNPTSANGNSFLQDQDINLNPYIGYRVKFKRISIDLLPGADVAFNFSSYDKGKATSANPPANQAPETYQTNLKRPNAPTDIRLRFGLAANYKSLSVLAGYAHGLTNYEKNMVGGSYNAHSELIRFGLAYKL